VFWRGWWTWDGWGKVVREQGGGGQYWEEGDCVDTQSRDKVGCDGERREVRGGGFGGNAGWSEAFGGGKRSHQGCLAA